MSVAGAGGNSTVSVGCRRGEIARLPCQRVGVLAGAWRLDIEGRDSRRMLSWRSFRTCPDPSRRVCGAPTAAIAKAKGNNGVCYFVVGADSLATSPLAAEVHRAERIRAHLRCLAGTGGRIMARVSSGAASTRPVLGARIDRIAASTLSAVEAAVAVVYLGGGGVGAVSMLIHAGLLGWALWRWNRPWSPPSELIVAGVYLLCTPLVVDGPAFTTAASPMLAVAGTVVVTVAMSRAVRVSLPATMIVVSAWASGAVLVPGVDRPWTIFSLDFLVVEWAVAAVLRSLVLRSAQITDDAFAQYTSSRIDAEVMAARRRDERETWATLHDTAASTLAMVGQGIVVDDDRLRAQARRDLQAVRRGAQALNTDDFARRIDERVRETATSVQFCGRAAGPDNPRTSQAVVAAVGEALTNVDRHADANLVTIEFGGTNLRIVDDGIGFDPRDAALSPDRFGIRNSIRRRLADAGATVEIVSSPGAGTAVEIRWGMAPEPDLRRDVDDALRLLRGYGYGLVVIAVVVSGLQGLNALSAAHPMAQIGILTAAVLTAFVAIAEIRYALPTALWWIAATVVLILAPLQTALLAPEQVTSSANWAVAALGWQLAALSVRRGSRIGLGLLGALWSAGTATAVAVASVGVLSTLLYTVISVTVLQGVALGFSDFLRWAVRRTRQAGTDLADLQIQTTLTAALHRDRRQRYQRMSRQLVPVLQQLANDPGSASKPAVRAACSLESTRLRRLFAEDPLATAALLDELAPSIEAAEARGIAVATHSIGSTVELDPQAHTEALTAAIILLAGTRTRAKIVITGTPDQRADLSITCDCDDTCTEAVTASSPQATLISSDGLVWATVPLP
ncbi:ATP-binding protein [Nocardia rhizosphaerae]|uniref:Sensor histidine kinase n=1 Tax=Nocardia rhizosphaerae TaxID=1691571 RepID=A0ABV8LCP9_9NOCA